MASAEFNEKVRAAYLLRKEAERNLALADELLDSLGELGSKDYPAGRFILKVTPTRRFNASEAQKNLTTEEFESIHERVPTSAAAKRVLGDERYAATQKVYGQTRKIVPVEDEE